MQRKYLWCPSDQHGDHEIALTYVIHPGNAASLDGIEDILRRHADQRAREMASGKFDEQFRWSQ